MTHNSDLLTRLGRGDLSAYDSLYVLYSQRVLNFAYRLTKDWSEAEDFTHDIFLKVWEDRAHISTVDSFSSYLFSMTKNAIFNSFRRADTKLKYSKQYSNSVQDEDITDKIDAQELELLIAITVENMPSERQEVFKLSRSEGLSYKEIAERLNISTKTVQYHISNALADIRKVVVAISVFFISC
ncbi:MAG: RNA polymerase sigma-70 factor [Rikenellaceae bacterium]